MLEAFRSINQMAINPRSLAPTGEARQVTGNLGDLVKPSISAKVQGLNAKYYALATNYKLSPREQKMLDCMNRKDWSEGFKAVSFTSTCKHNLEEMQEMVKMTELFTKDMEGRDSTKTKAKKEQEQEEQIKKYGKLNAKHRLEDSAHRLMHENIVSQLKTMVGSHSFN